MICFTLDNLYPIIQFPEQVSHNALSHQFEHQLPGQHAFSARLQNSACAYGRNIDAIVV